MTKHEVLNALHTSVFNNGHPKIPKQLILGLLLKKPTIQRTMVSPRSPSTTNSKIRPAAAGKKCFKVVTFKVGSFAPQRPKSGGDPSEISRGGETYGIPDL